MIVLPCAERKNSLRIIFVEIQPHTRMTLHSSLLCEYRVLATSLDVASTLETLGNILCHPNTYRAGVVHKKERQQCVPRREGKRDTRMKGHN